MCNYYCQFYIEKLINIHNCKIKKSKYLTKYEPLKYTLNICKYIRILYVGEMYSENTLHHFYTAVC